MGCSRESFGEMLVGGGGDAPARRGKVGSSLKTLSSMKSYPVKGRPALDIDRQTVQHVLAKHTTLYQGNGGEGGGGGGGEGEEGGPQAAAEAAAELGLSLTALKCLCRKMNVELPSLR